LIFEKEHIKDLPEGGVVVDDFFDRESFFAEFFLIGADE
jgi:hypothetical protein